MLDLCAQPDRRRIFGGGYRRLGRGDGVVQGSSKNWPRNWRQAGEDRTHARFVLARALFDQSEADLSNRPAEARKLNDRATAILQALVDANPGVDDFQEMLAMALRIRATYRRTPSRRLPLSLGELKIREKLADAKPDAWKFQDSLAIIHNNIASCLDELGRLSEALASRTAGGLRSGNERLMPTPPSHTPEQRGFRLEHRWLVALAIGQTGRGSRGALRRRRRFSRSLPTPIPANNVLTRGISPRATATSARLMQQTGQPARALAEFEQESPIWNELARGGNSAYREFTGILRDEQGRCAVGFGPTRRGTDLVRPGDFDPRGPGQGEPG